MLSPSTVISSGLAGFSWLVVLAVLAVLAIVAIQLRTSTRTRRATTALIPDNVALSAKPILSDAEAKFFHSLETAVGGQYLVCPQLPLWTFIDIHSNHAGAATAFTNRINLKRIDFILVDRQTLTVQMAIELDDRSHQRSDRQRRDAFVETVLKQAGVPLIRIPAGRAYDSKAIRAQLGITGTDLNDRKLA